jgi:MoaE-MoaD fusion protein
MTVRVRLFAILKDRAGVDAFAVDVSSDARVADALDAVVSRHPTLAGLVDRSAVAVNREYAPRTHPLNEGDELALIPPVSGG